MDKELVGISIDILPIDKENRVFDTEEELKHYFLNEVIVGENRQKYVNNVYNNKELLDELEHDYKNNIDEMLWENLWNGDLWGLHIIQVKYKAQ